MSVLDLIITALALSMDAFAVAIGKGLSCRKYRLRNSLVTGLYFGGFQALMPLIGFFLAALFSRYIRAVDHWIAFGLMALIGANMIREAVGGEDEEKMDASFGLKAMLPLAIATSIDALASGISFAVVDANIWAAVSLIGVITFLLSALGVKIGNVFGAKYQAKAEFTGGLILILMGIKILVEHLSGAA